MTDDARKYLGQRGERLAAEHLQRCGFDVLDRNYRTKWGELDIVAFNGDTLAFCEVKTRTTAGTRTALGAMTIPRTGTPLEAIGRRKRDRVRKMAARWLIDRTDRPFADRIRFDAIGVTVDPAGRLLKLEHLEGAF